MRPLNSLIVAKRLQAEKKGLIEVTEESDFYEVTAIGPKCEGVKVGDKIVARSGKKAGGFVFFDECDVMAVVE